MSFSRICSFSECTCGAGPTFACSWYCKMYHILCGRAIELPLTVSQGFVHQRAKVCFESVCSTAQTTNPPHSAAKMSHSCFFAKMSQSCFSAKMSQSCFPAKVSHSHSGLKVSHSHSAAKVSHSHSAAKVSHSHSAAKVIHRRRQEIWHGKRFVADRPDRSQMREREKP